jgi:DNA-binding NarL/FixJ family response regulator
MEAKGKIRLALVDDHSIFRDGIELMLKLNPSVDLVASLPNARTLFEWLKSNEADIFILDINLPKISGIELAKQLSRDLNHPKIIFLTSNTAKMFIDSAIKTGARGFLTKDCSKEELFNAIDKVFSNQYHFGQSIEQSLYENYAHHLSLLEDKTELSEREIQVMRAFANGMTYKEVEEELNISKKTIETHRKNIFDKLGLKNQTDLVKYAIKHHIIEL